VLVDKHAPVTFSAPQFEHELCWEWNRLSWSGTADCL